MNVKRMTDRIQTVYEYIGHAEQIMQVPGYLHSFHGFALMTVAEEGPGQGAVVEIGSYMGLSTCWLATGCKRAGRGKVYAVDHFRGSPEHQVGEVCEDARIAAVGTTLHAFKEHLAAQQLEDWVEPVVASSAEAAAQWDGKPIRLLFIDADHSYEVSKLDFDCWSPFVEPGGLIAFHDIGTWPGVTQFYTELLTGRPEEFEQVISCRELRFIIKKRHA